jgi:hypothetical protein
MRSCRSQWYNARVDSNGHKRCLGCGYILDGLPEPRCPECGRGFDPDDPETFSHVALPKNRYAIALAALLMALMSAIMSLGNWATIRPEPGVDVIAAGLAISSLWVTFGNLRRVRSWGAPRRVRAVNRALAVPALLFAVGSLLWQATLLIARL